MKTRPAASLQLTFQGGTHTSCGLAGAPATEKTTAINELHTPPRRSIVQLPFQQALFVLSAFRLHKHSLSSVLPRTRRELLQCFSTVRVNCAPRTSPRVLTTLIIAPQHVAAPGREVRGGARQKPLCLDTQNSCDSKKTCLKKKLDLWTDSLRPFVHDETLAPDSTPSVLSVPL